MSATEIESDRRSCCGNKKAFNSIKTENEGIQRFPRKQFGRLASSFSLTEKLVFDRECSMQYPANNRDEHNQIGILTPDS